PNANAACGACEIDFEGQNPKKSIVTTDSVTQPHGEKHPRTLRSRRPPSIHLLFPGPVLAGVRGGRRAVSFCNFELATARLDVEAREAAYSVNARARAFRERRLAFPFVGPSALFVRGEDTPVSVSKSGCPFVHQSPGFIVIGPSRIAERGPQIRPDTRPSPRAPQTLPSAAAIVGSVRQAPSELPRIKRVKRGHREGVSASRLAAFNPLACCSHGGPVRGARGGAGRVPRRRQEGVRGAVAAVPPGQERERRRQERQRRERRRGEGEGGEVRRGQGGVRPAQRRDAGQQGRAPGLRAEDELHPLSVPDTCVFLADRSNSILCPDSHNRNDSGFCQESKLQELLEAGAAEATDRARDAHKRLSDATKAAKTQREEDLVETNRTLTREVDASDEANKGRLRRLGAALEAQIEQFERMGAEQRTELVRSLEARRAHEIRLGENRATSHVRDLSTAHESRMGEMEACLLSVEMRQEMDIESLRASIRRMEKAAADHASLSEELRESNEVNGRRLELCSAKAGELKSKIKNKEKNLESMSPRERSGKLTHKYNEVEEERNDLIGLLEGAVERASSRSRGEQARLAERLDAQESANELLDRNLEHICRSASSTLRAEDVEAAARKQLAERDDERERLVKRVAKAEADYGRALRAARLDLVKNGVAADTADSIDVLSGTQK
ncbi:hypothetical protein THAOC_25683, partial [Thalassiosira oceanica]